MVRNSGRSLLDGNMGCFEAISLCFCSDVFIFQPFPSYFSIKYSFKSYGNFYHDKLLDFLIPPHNVRTQVRGSNVSGEGVTLLTSADEVLVGLCFGLMAATMTSRTLSCLVLYLCWSLATLQQFSTCISVCLSPHGAGACESVSASHHTGQEHVNQCLLLTTRGRSI